MRKWGIIITIFYALVLVILLTPAFVLLAENPSRVVRLFTDFSAGWPFFAKALGEAYRLWPYWLWIGFLVGAQALLLFLSADTSTKRLRPRQHVALSITLTALLLSILTFAAILSLALGVDDKLSEKIFFWPHKSLGVLENNTSGVIAVTLLVYWMGPWILWGLVFYMYMRDASALITRLVSWLLKGSVLELLIAVPSHILVRQRNECTAPTVTSFGIVTGLAIMLLSFGPSVLFLYKKRLDQYKKKTPTIRANTS